MAYHLQHEEHPAMVQAAISSYSRDIRLVSLSGEQVVANKLLLVLYSPILRDLLMTENSSSDSIVISLPLSTEAIMALLDLLAKGRTFSSEDAHLLEVVEAGALLGLSLGKLQLGSRKVKTLKAEDPQSRKVKTTFKRGKFGLRDQEVGDLEGLKKNTRISSLEKEDKNPKDSTKVENMLNDELGEQGQQQKEDSSKARMPSARLDDSSSSIYFSARLDDQNMFPSPNPREENPPFGELTKTGAKIQLLNPCLVCDKDFIYPSLLSHHQKSVHHSELLNEKESKGLQCDNCQFSTQKLAFLKTHNKFMHPKT